MATRGCGLTISINKGHNKLLAHTTFTDFCFFPGSTGCIYSNIQECVNQNAPARRRQKYYFLTDCTIESFNIFCITKKKTTIKRLRVKGNDYEWQTNFVGREIKATENKVCTRKSGALVSFCFDILPAQKEPDVISHSAAEYQSVPGKPLPSLRAKQHFCLLLH